MARIKETITFEIDGKQIEAEHEGKEKMDAENLDALRTVITEQMGEGKEKGFLPYSNFEYSVSWYIKEK